MTALPPCRAYCQDTGVGNDVIVYVTVAAWKPVPDGAVTYRRATPTDPAPDRNPVTSMNAIPLSDYSMPVVPATPSAASGRTARPFADT